MPMMFVNVNGQAQELGKIGPFGYKGGIANFKPIPLNKQNYTQLLVHLILGHVREPQLFSLESIRIMSSQASSTGRSLV